VNDKWFWTTALTPGKENIISVTDSESVIKVTKSMDSGAKKSKQKIVVETTLEKIKELEVGDLVKTTGIVAVLPGVLGSQYFYIVGSPGVQVYSYKKDFPNLRIGDYVEVNGELSISNGEQRIKTKQADDIKVIEHREAPVADKFTCEEVNEEFTGQLVSVTGEVVERKSSNVYLDDGTDEVLAYIKKATGINTGNIKEGEIITLTGLVSRTKTGIRIMPRFWDDIIKKDPESQSGESGQVLGEVAVSDEWAIAQRDKKLELFKYLLIIAGGIIVFLSILLVKLNYSKP
jgi:DNA/RNA endonuclease YhcR with UshA esterase domain